MISSRGVEIETIESWPEPESVHDVQAFIGFTGFYRRFIEGYSKICAQDRSNKNQRQEAFETEDTASPPQTLQPPVAISRQWRLKLLVYAGDQRSFPET
jgi:hypothetical protein